MSCPDILEALLVVWAKWQLRVSLFLKANWTSVLRGKQREKKVSLISRLSVVECIFYELAGPSWSTLRPRVAMLARCQALLTRNPSSSVLIKLTQGFAKESY